MDANSNVKCSLKVKKRIIDNTLGGRVIIISQHAIEIRQAFIEITGVAKCSWNLNAITVAFPRFYPQNTTVRGFQQFYYTRHFLCGGDIAMRHVGEESYIFRCYWPSRLPGTWYGDFGEIIYVAKITIKTEDPVAIYTHTQPLIVNFRRDLTTERHLLFEARVDVTRNFYTSKSLGSVSVSVWLPICGIAAGQSLPVLCSVINHSKLNFGSLIFVLTRTDIYRSNTPVATTKRVRTDVCRVARMVNIHQGRHEYFAVLKTQGNLIPTSQFFKCTCCQIIYDVWVSVQGAFKRYRSYGYPNIDTPAIPLIIGTKPLRKFDCHGIRIEVFKKLQEYQQPIYVDELPEDFKQIITTTEEELSKEAIENLERQLVVNEKNISSHKQLVQGKRASNT